MLTLENSSELLIGVRVCICACVRVCARVCASVCVVVLKLSTPSDPGGYLARCWSSVSSGRMYKEPASHEFRTRLCSCLKVPRGSVGSFLRDNEESEVQGA